MIKFWSAFKLCFCSDFLLIYYCILYYYLPEASHMSGRNMSEVNAYV